MEGGVVNNIILLADSYKVIVVFFLPVATITWILPKVMCLKQTNSGYRLCVGLPVVYDKVDGVIGYRVSGNNLLGHAY